MHVYLYMWVYEGWQSMGQQTIIWSCPLALSWSLPV